MTHIEFIVNVENKLAKAAELCEKEVTKGRLVTISSDNEAHLPEIQNTLWQVSPHSFLPMHTLENSEKDSYFSEFCTIHFALHNEFSTQHNFIQDDVLLHFHALTPPFFSRFRYLFELVGLEESDKAAARLRYKFYRDRGYDIKTTRL